MKNNKGGIYLLKWKIEPEEMQVKLYKLSDNGDYTFETFVKLTPSYQMDCIFEDFLDLESIEGETVVDLEEELISSSVSIIIIDGLLQEQVFFGPLKQEHLKKFVEESIYAYWEKPY